MSKLEKILVFCAIRKGDETNIGSDKQFIAPVMLRSNDDDEMQPEKMSPLTSEEEADEDEDKKKLEKLHRLLASDNPELLEDYVNREFANLGQDEIIDKLMLLDEESRSKLINFIVEYQQREGGNAEPLQEIENADVDMKADIYSREENIQMQNFENNNNNEINDTQLKGTDYQSAVHPHVNENLSYLGFSGPSTDLLRNEIFRSQSAAQNQNMINDVTMLSGQINQISQMNQNQSNIPQMTQMNQMQMPYAQYNQFMMNNYQLRQMMMQGNIHPYMMQQNMSIPQNMNVPNQPQSGQQQNPSNQQTSERKTKFSK